MLLRVNVKVNVFIFFYGLRILFANKAIWLQFPIPFLPLLWKVSKKAVSVLMTSNYCICLYPLPHAIAYLQGVCEWRKWCMQKVIVGGEDEIIALFIVHLLFVYLSL